MTPEIYEVRHGPSNSVPGGLALSSPSTEVAKRHQDGLGAARATGLKVREGGAPRGKTVTAGALRAALPSQVPTLPASWGLSGGGQAPRAGGVLGAVLWAHETHSLAVGGVGAGSTWRGVRSGMSWWAADHRLLQSHLLTPRGHKKGVLSCGLG